MRRFLTVFLFAAICSAGEEEEKRLKESADALKEIQSNSEKSIPQALFDKAVCVVVVPEVKKGGFVVAGQYGRGFASCRESDGSGWTAPVGMRLEGGSVGLQAGGAASDVVLLIMNAKGMERLLSSKFTIGGEASAAAGPVGRDAKAMTDASMSAEILSWSMSRGVFGGVSLNGSTLRDDKDADKGLYGHEVDRKNVLEGKVEAPPAAQGFIAELTKVSPSKSN